MILKKNKAYTVSEHVSQKEGENECDLDRAMDIVGKIFQK